MLGLFLIKLKVCRPVILLKRDSKASAFQWSFKNTYFEEHLQTAASILLTLFTLAYPHPQLFSRNKNSVAKEPSNFDLLIPWSTKELIFHANTHFSRKIRSFPEPNCYMIWGWWFLKVMPNAHYASKSCISGNLSILLGEERFDNYFHDFFGISDLLLNFLFSTSELMRDYYW